MKEDPTFKVIRDLETNQVVVTGMGELHLEIYQQVRLSQMVDLNCLERKYSHSNFHSCDFACKV